MLFFDHKYFKLVSILLFLISLNVFCQEKTIKHIVKKGETIYSIARENNISVDKIFALNPNAKKTLKLNAVLLLPDNNAVKNSEILSLEKTHTVLQKETLYGISKKYKISIENLKKWNPILENSSLEIGQIINIVSNENISTNENYKNNNQTIIHEVLSKETLYSLSKKYKTSIVELEKLNPEIKNGLPIGFKLIVSKAQIADIEKNEKSETIEKIIKQKDSVLIPEIVEIKEEPQEIVIPKDSISVVKPISNLELSDKLYQRGSEQIGSRYRSGGTQPGAFDCSGLMIYIFEDSGVKLPRTSAEQSRFGTKINNSEAQKGDLIFFSTNGRGYINHVGMVVENIDGEIKFIHSSVHGGVIISSVSEKYYTNKVKQVNRVLN